MIQQRFGPRRGGFQQSGQALVEYVLTVLLVLGLFTMFNNAIVGRITSLWKVMAGEIASACPACERPEQIQ